LRSGPDRQIRYARYLALLFVAAGFAAIGFGWNGAARSTNPDSQLPYLLSGGAAGIGLIVLGVGVMMVAQIRGERRRLQGIVDLMGPAATSLLPAAEMRAEGRAEPFVLQVRHARLISLLFVFAGFVAIGLGWSGMARSAAPDQQLPFIVSGGMGGVGLITFGVGLLLVAQIRTERQRLTTVLEVMASAVARVTGGKPLPEDEMGAAPGDTLVVAGPSTFHRPDCRLVQGKPGLDRLTIQVARSTGLSPCRVCDPLGATQGGAGAQGRETLVSVGADGRGEGRGSAAETEKAVRLEQSPPASDETKESKRPTLPGDPT